MARIPTYKPFQVDPNVRQAPAFSTPQTPGAAQITGRQMEQFGQGLGEIGSAMERVALQEMDAINKARLRESTHEFLSYVRNRELEANQLSAAELVRPDGETGMAMADQIMGEVQKFRADMIEQMPNDWLRENLDARTDKIFLDFSDRSIALQATRKKELEANARDAEISYATQTIVLDPTAVDENGRPMVDGLDEVLAEKLEADGGDPNDERQMTVFRQDFYDSVVPAEITNLVERNQLPKAEQLLDALGSRMSPLERAAVRAQIDAGKQSFEVMTTVRTMIDEGLTEREAYARVREFPPELQEKLEQRIAVEYGRAEDLKTAEQTDLFERLSDRLVDPNDPITIDDIENNSSYLSILTDAQIKALRLTERGGVDPKDIDVTLYTSLITRIGDPNISLDELRSMRTEIAENYDALGPMANSVRSALESAITNYGDVPAPNVSDITAINQRLDALLIPRNSPGRPELMVQWDNFQMAYKAQNGVDRVPEDVRAQWVNERTVRMKWDAPRGTKVFRPYEMLQRSTTRSTQRYDIEGVPNEYEMELVTAMATMGMSYDAGVVASKSKARQMHNAVMQEYAVVRSDNPARNFPERPDVFMYQLLLNDMMQRGMFD
jgi:hypothetical protein